MKFDKAIEKTKQELLNKCKDVIYKGSEVVKMTSNTTTSDYTSEQIDIDATIDVIPIKNRFIEIEGKIKAIKVIFDVKLPNKRKYSKHEVYFRIIN